MKRLSCSLTSGNMPAPCPAHDGWYPFPIPPLGSTPAAVGAGRLVRAAFRIHSCSQTTPAYASALTATGSIGGGGDGCCPDSDENEDRRVCVLSPVPYRRPGRVLLSFCSRRARQPCLVTVGLPFARAHRPSCRGNFCRRRWPQSANHARSWCAMARRTTDYPAPTSSGTTHVCSHDQIHHQHAM
jgi:hypothetical protein